MRVRPRPALALAIVAVAAVAAVGAVWRRSSSVAVAARPAAAAVPVDVATVVRKDVPIVVQALGTVQPIETVNVQSRVNGQIMQAFFTQGQVVKKGDPLFLIDPRPYQAALDQAQAQLEHDQALLAEAKTDLARYQNLEKENSIAAQQAEDQAFVVQQDEGTVKLDQANVETAKLNLGYAHINSPADGLSRERCASIRAITCRPGAGTTLVTITQISPIYVTFPIPQTDSPKFAPPRPRRRSTCARCRRKERPSATASSPSSTTRSRRRPAPSRSTRPSPTPTRRFGRTSSSPWTSSSACAKNALTAPIASVMSGPDGDYVYMSRPDNVARRVPVHVVARQNGLAVFYKGVSPGEQVVVNGQYNLANGVKVAIEPPKATASAAPRGPRRPRARRHEHLGSLHPPADRDRADDGRSFRLRRGLLHAAAGRRAAQRRIPDDLGVGEFPGASPTVMASTVATPLEDQFTAIPGLASMTSTSGLGSTSITLQFDLSTSVTADAGYVEQAIQAASALLPKTLPTPPTYRVANPADAPILIYAVHSDAYPIQELDQYANILIGQSLSRVNGVGQVVIAGQAQPAVQVRLNPNALAAKGLGFAQISAALTSESALQPTGNLEGRHEEFPLDVNQQLTNAAQFRKVIVAYSNGAPVELGDIATVVDGPQNPRTGAWFGTKRAEVLLVFKAPGANTLDVVDRIKAMMPQLEKSIPRAVHVDLVADRSLSIRASVSDVEFTLVLALALVVMVIFLFLRKFWATVIPSITLPVVIVETFAAMYLLGYSIDNLSLMALTIAIGFLVDDAIVMIENIVRHIEAGKPPLEAALDGAGEIGFTILSITLSLAAVFIPVLFMSGVVGLLFHEFGMVTILAIFLSGFVSLTLTPMMCAQFLTRESGEQQGRFSRWLERGFDRMRDLYDRGLVWALRHEFLMLLVTIALIA